MKKKYVAPQMFKITVTAEHFLAASETTASVYTDDAQTVESALTKENNYNVWDDDWNK